MEPEILSSTVADDEAAPAASLAAPAPADESSSETGAEPETPSARAMLTADDIGRMLAEAEQRGYLRGRNERAEAMINRPLLFENPRRSESEPEAARTSGEGLTEGFLSGLRAGVWD